MTTSETTISTESQEPKPEPTVVVAGGTSTTDQSTVDHAGRLATIEERLNARASQDEEYNTRLGNVETGLSSLSESVKSGLEAVTSSIGELTGKLSEGASSIAEKVVEPITHTPDSAPASKGHWFFEGFGKKSA